MCATRFIPESDDDSSTDTGIDNGVTVPVVDLGVEFTYKIPSFSVIEVEVRQATYQIEQPDGSACLYDGFLKSDPSLPDPSRSSDTPFSITIQKHCFVPVEEFTKAVYVAHLRAVQGHGLLVVWDWVVSNEGSQTSSEEGGGADDRASSEELFASQDEDSQECFVPFKCIGVTRDPQYQTILREVRDRMQSGETVSVRMKPEPTNIFDSEAIAFECYHQDAWQTIGYVVSEICGEVLAAINQGDIVSVEFSWVKYKLWKKSPGIMLVSELLEEENGQWMLRDAVAPLAKSRAQFHVINQLVTYESKGVIVYMCCDCH